MKKILITLMFIAGLSLFAQYPIQINSVNFHGDNPIFNHITPSSFDPDKPNSQTKLFSLDINWTGTDQPDFDLIFIFQWQDNVSESFVHNLKNSLPLHLVSSDLIRSSGVAEYQIDSNFDVVFDAMKDQVIATGQLPDGLYTFKFVAVVPGTTYNTITNDNKLSEESVLTFNIKYPNPITLISPGSPIGMGATTTSDMHPYFVWFSNLTDYTFKLWELDDESYTVSQIETLDPYYGAKNIKENSLSFPLEKTLRSNVIYAWQVSAKIQTPSDEEPIQKSNIYLFKIGEDNGNSGNNDILISILSNYLSDDNEGVQDLIELLKNGYQLKPRDYNILLAKLSKFSKIISAKVQ